MNIFSYTFIIVNSHNKILDLQTREHKVYIHKSANKYKNTHGFTSVIIQMEIQISANCEFLC